jgi:hypothetical protein
MARAFMGRSLGRNNWGRFWISPQGSRRVVRTGPGLLSRATEKFVELDFEACRARVLGVRDVFVFC